MNLDQIETKCFILALFIRDDGERFLLGSRAYEFVDSQLHFVANSYQNDIVEVQGNDGVMLAGQVRRGTSQPFDGYIGDQTVDRPTIEQYRRDFMKFFRKNHYYKVVYVFPDGSAVQRRNGFIVEAPEVKELYQLFPQYHISMNFEDINYYLYEEDAEGEEIYGESAILKIATSATGGLIWEEGTESQISGEGSQFTLQDTIDGNVLDSVQLKGDTFQQTYSGKNLFNINGTVTEPSATRNISGNTLTATMSSTGGNRYLAIEIPNSSGLLGKTVTLSYTLKNISGANSARLSMYFGTLSSPARDVIFDGVAKTSSSVGETVERTATIPSSFPTSGQSIFIMVYANTNSTSVSTIESVEYSNIQLEVDSTASSFEPYVGGTASPNPDYPQEVQTATGRQVIDVYGKNLFDGELELGEYDANNGNKFANNSRYRCANKIPVQPNTTYTFSINGVAQKYVYYMYDGTGAFLQATDTQTGTLTTISNCYYLTFRCFAADFTSNYSTLKIQLEKGSTATPYESHQSYEVNLGKNLFNKDNANTVDGYFNQNTTQIQSLAYASIIYIPCDPNTTYTIQRDKTGFGSFSFGYTTTLPQVGTTVYGIVSSSQGVATTTTGTGAKYLVARIYHNTQDTLSFAEVLATVQIEKGSTASTYAPYFEPIELCKIGDYQDYIYKNGSDWYIHKEIGKYVYNNDLSTNGISATRVSMLTPSLDVVPGMAQTAGVFYSNMLTPTVVDYSGIGGTTNASQIRVNCSINITSTYDGFRALAAQNNLTIYYPLATPTDTQITNTALIAQLNALASATTYDGQTVFAVSSPNQLAILDVIVIARTGGGVVWDNYGAEWEEGTGGGPTMVNVDSIDNVYPVLTLTGPAVNPQISVLTTNTTLSYSGTITSSQELKIDMFNKTATLNGASVVGNVSGDWVYLKPGVNRITYTTNNADAPDSTLWWQEIVG